MNVCPSIWVINERCSLSCPEVLCLWNKIFYYFCHHSEWYYCIWHHQGTSWWSTFPDISRETCGKSWSISMHYIDLSLIQMPLMNPYPGPHSVTVMNNCWGSSCAYWRHTLYIVESIVFHTLTVSSLQTYLSSSLLSQLQPNWASFFIYQGIF